MENVLRPCEIDRDFYDADFLTADLYEAVRNAGENADQELNSIEEAVTDTITAIKNCAQCPFFEACKQATLEQIEQRVGPAGVVQAGIYWGLDHRPDFTLNGCLSSKSAQQAAERSCDITSNPYRVDEHGNRWPLTVPVYVNSPESTASTDTGGPIDADLDAWDTSWVPPIADPINYEAVDLTVTSNRAGIAIPLAKVRRFPEIDVTAKEILTDSEVCEVLRRMSATNQSVTAMAQRLSLTFPTVTVMLKALGLPVPYSENHRRAAQRREERRRYNQRITRMSVASPGQQLTIDQFLREGENANTGKARELVRAGAGAA